MHLIPCLQSCVNHCSELLDLGASGAAELTIGGRLSRESLKLHVNGGSWAHMQPGRGDTRIAAKLVRRWIDLAGLGDGPREIGT